MAIPGYMVTDAKEVPEDRNNEDEDDGPLGPELPVLKVLALHDSESTGIDFAKTLEPIQEVIKEEHELDLQITAPWAPWSKPKEYGSSWWTMPYGQQSYNAFEYIGFEASCNMVISEIEAENPDLILAHSQGAILISAMLALGRISKHPRLGYVLNGVAWPKPFERELRGLKLRKNGKECIGPQMLLIIGSKDETSPPDSAERVKKAFEKAGFRVSSCTHPGGNAIPIDNEVVKQELVEW
eukprot:CAMPEP_0195288962 /NCGR_PEP_ID=MMETSP0707-20130614/5425_1 /TAXON_ID=33640 /ORGANISM="Asterionellopsis glacialis, Strain CCMP134" /LENGTH=239 /DNA_ID=CAMNT_0040348907 /DNA_START=277 /DNA_END=993 /DNA_ORIENTATION=+